MSSLISWRVVLSGYQRCQSWLLFPWRVISPAPKAGHDEPCTASENKPGHIDPVGAGTSLVLATLTDPRRASITGSQRQFKSAPAVGSAQVGVSLYGPLSLCPLAHEMTIPLVALPVGQPPAGLPYGTLCE